jgi:hypothetical protein
MKNRMQADMTSDMHASYALTSDTIDVSNDVGSIIYNMGLFITDYDSHKRFSYFGMKTK